jgi:hypothetical protein
MVNDLCTVTLNFEYANGLKDTVINSQVYKSDRDEYIDNMIKSHKKLAKLNKTTLKSYKCEVHF